VRRIEVTVEGLAEMERIDVFLSRTMEELTRSAAQRLIGEGNVTVNGAVCRPSLKLEGGESVAVVIPPPVPAVPEAEEIPLDVFYEDSDVVVVNKSAGMVVHPGAGNSTGTLVNALLAHCGDLSGIGGEIRPGIVHRIDKDTSGLLVVAKNDRAHEGLSQQFRDHTIKRIYQALVFGSPREETGRIVASLSRHPVDRKRMTGKRGEGKEAATRWKVLARYGEISLLQLRLETGRTHQIRVHLSEAGFPLVGDEVYGGTARGSGLRDTALRREVRLLGRQALHARVLGFIHPVSREYLEFEAELPDDMARLLRYLEESKK
jgi:23S rRNA pseudouridine1911/1915/1917 synthase